MKILSQKGVLYTLGWVDITIVETMELTQGFLIVQDAHDSFLTLSHKLLAAVLDREKSGNHPNVSIHKSCSC